jgi:hypothetical protein
LTDKYNDIKDYFEKKYNKPSNEDGDCSEGYQEAKASEFE